MGKHLKNRYYKQILAVLFIVSLVPVMFLSYFMYSFVNQQRTAVYRTAMSQLENDQQEFEISFSYVDMALIRLGLKDTCLSTIGKEREAKNFQAFNALQEELQLISNTETELEELYLVSQQQGWILGNTSFHSIEEDANQKMIQMLLRTEQSAFWYRDQDQLYMCRRIPINSKTGRGMLIAKFDTRTMLHQKDRREEGERLLLIDKENMVMAGAGKSSHIWDDIRVVKEIKNENAEIDVSEVRFQDEKYVMFQKISDYNGWKYLLLVPQNQIYGNLKRISYIILFVIFNLLMLDVAVIVLASKKLYSPIGKIDETVTNGMRYAEDAPETIRAEDGLMERVEYMVNKNVEMKQKLKKDQKDGQQLFLRKIYQGEITDPDQKIFEKNGFQLKQFDSGMFFVMAVKYNCHFATPEDKQLYLFALDNIVNELIIPEETFPPVLIGSLLYLTFYMKTDSAESAGMKAQLLAVMITTTVKKYMGYPVNIGISQGFTQLKNIKTGAEESKKALQDAIGAEGEVKFYHSHSTASEHTASLGVKKQRVQLMHSVDIGEPEACKKELVDYIQEISTLPYYVFKLEICKLVSEILNVYNDYALNPDYEKVGDIVDFDITKTVNNCEKLNSYLWEYLLEPLFATICSQAKDRDMMQQIIEYLLDNIEQDINLEECARHFNYNSNYLSRWFKKKTGMTYTDFITNKKMERCKTLLAETDISVNELAERFGYSSPQNFIRVFKKYTLLTPGQYRKNERERRK